MGTTLTNYHVLDGDEQQLRSLLPAATVGRWSERFVSVYCEAFRDMDDKPARSLSRKTGKTVLLVWLFDSDAVRFTIYRSGKRIFEHILHPEYETKMGNISLFCESLGLPDDDVRRLRTVWKNGNAEVQLELMAMLLGLPLCNDHDTLPDRQYIRDTAAVDKWIADRPTLPKIKSETKALLVQELKNFNMHGAGKGHYFNKDGDIYRHWKPDADGVLRSDWATEQWLDLAFSEDRVLAHHDGIIHFDSAGLTGYKAESLTWHETPDGGRSRNDSFYTLPDGGILWQETWAGSFLVRCASDGTEMWRRKADETAVWGIVDNDIILTSGGWGREPKVERVDGLTGVTIESLQGTQGHCYAKVYKDGYWWVSSAMISKEKHGNFFQKLNDKLEACVELPIPSTAFNLLFSPDCKYVYAFCYEKQVMVVDAETMTVEGILDDKAYLRPIGFDKAERLWISRGYNTIEAWDKMLTKLLSRHKLKGEFIGEYFNEQSDLCVVAFCKKDKSLCVYRVN